MQKFFTLLSLLAATQIAAVAEPEVKNSKPVVPHEVISLFNGKDLSAFYTWLVDYHREDPFRIFSVVDCLDGAPAIRISGQIYGGLYTRQQYANYRLVAEFRWGLTTWGSRTNATKDSGVVLHCTGPDGNYYSSTFNGPWMRGYEFQIIQGGVGDILVLGGYDPDGSIVKYSATLNTSPDRDGEPIWDPKGEPKVFQTGRINWWGRDVDWEDKLGFRGRQDVESPDGQWTRLEVICRGATLDYYVNGQRVNHATQLSHQAGQLIFQSEGAEIYFRKIELHPLPAAQ